MMRLSLLFVAALALAPLHASAEKWVQPPATSKSSFVFIGMVNGDAWMLQSGGAQTCAWWRLGTGGLDDDYRVTLGGGNDSVEVTDNTFPISCGGSTWMFAPLNARGHKVSVSGGLGNDFMVLGRTSGTFSTLNGSTGDDTLVIHNDWGETHGSTGNDFLYGEDYRAQHYGEDGDDKICTHIAATWDNVWDIQGGTGWDTRCGRGNRTLTIEGINCPICGPGF